MCYPCAIHIWIPERQCREPQANTSVWYLKQQSQGSGTEQPNHHHDHEKC